MPYIILDNQQTNVISESKERTEIRDRNGRHSEYIAHGFTEEDIAIAKERMASDELRYTTKQVLDYLGSTQK
tara:strand:+ start:68 stop:283 length:216 start_codon:yes stop_codon:yes gene_type:complete